MKTSNKNSKKLLTTISTITLSLSLLLTPILTSPTLAQLSYTKLIRPLKITINKNTASIPINSTEQLIPTIFPSNATNQEVTWKSSNTKVATIDSTGIITAIKEGKSAITATTVDNKKSAKCIITVTANSPSPSITFKDINFENAIRKTLNKPTGDIVEIDVQKITKLSVSESIKDISGIEYLTNLREFSLSNSSVSDISSLSGLKKLKKLSLVNNEITDITPIEGLTNLTFLDLSNSSPYYFEPHQNRISDLSALSGLKNLKNLVLSSDDIYNYTPLSSLNGLKSLYLKGSTVSDYYRKVLRDILPDCSILFVLI